MNENQKNIEIRPIPGFENEYYITNYGDVYSVGGRPGTISSDRKLKQFIKKGYWTVELYSNGSSKKIAVHRLVLLTFLGLPTDKNKYVKFKDSNVNNMYVGCVPDYNDGNICYQDWAGVHGDAKKKRDKTIGEDKYVQ